jgi:hypothetical protein
VSYAVEWVPGAAVVGIVALFWVPSIALIGLFVVLLAAVAVVVALAGAVVAAPYLLGRSIRGRLRARRGADLDSTYRQPAASHRQVPGLSAPASQAASKEQLTALAAMPRHPARQSGRAT